MIALHLQVRRIDDQEGALSTVVDCDEILVMREGQIAERGTHADLIAMEGLYATMWARQASGFDMERGQTALYEAAIQ